MLQVLQKCSRARFFMHTASETFANTTQFLQEFWMSQLTFSSRSDLDFLLAFIYKIYNAVIGVANIA